MATTIDHLRVHHRITVLRDFVDARGTWIRAGETGVLTKLDWDSLRMEILLVIERDSGTVELVFEGSAGAGPNNGPGNGRMREFFEIGEDVTPPRAMPGFRDPAKRQMLLPPPGTPSSQRKEFLCGPDRLFDVEAEMLAATDQIGVAASIAELYAERMRAFQRAGNEPRAIAAFKLAVDWMGRYAASATSGGEGAALSQEGERFRAALAREFGYDPTGEEHPLESDRIVP